MHCSLHGVIIGLESDTKSFVPFQGFALCARAWREISRERALGYPPPHTVAPARWQAEKKQNQKAAVGGKKSPAVRRNKNSYLRRPNPFHSIILVRVTPTAKRNSYRVAILVGVYTQGSVLRPQPWAGETHLRQSCCCLRGSPSPGPPQGAGVLSCCGLGHYNLLRVRTLGNSVGVAAACGGSLCGVNP